jgi:hypothetical protein
VPTRPLPRRRSRTAVPFGEVPRPTCRTCRTFPTRPTRPTRPSLVQPTAAETTPAPRSLPASADAAEGDARRPPERNLSRTVLLEKRCLLTGRLRRKGPKRSRRALPKRGVASSCPATRPLPAPSRPSLALAPDAAVPPEPVTPTTVAERPAAPGTARRKDHDKTLRQGDARPRQPTRARPMPRPPKRKLRRCQAGART